LATAGKHVSNTRAIVRKLLGKRVPASTDTQETVAVLLDYNSGTGVFYVVRVEIWQLAFGIEGIEIVQLWDIRRTGRNKAPKLKNLHC
jgi:hypothetical protein